MTKIKKRNLILTFAAVMFAALAVLIFMTAPKQAKADEIADEPVRPNYSAYRKITDETITNLSGVILAVKTEYSAPSAGIVNLVDLDVVFTPLTSDMNITPVPDAPAVIINYRTEIYTDSYLIYASDISAEESALFLEEDESTWFVYYIPQIIDFPNGESVNMDEKIFNISNNYEEVSFYGIFDEPVTPEEPSEPTEPEQPGETPSGEQPSDNPTNEPTETNTNEKKPFDFGEWLHNAGEDVSAWLGDNVGIATTGSTVLIVGAVILAVIIFRKRR